MKKILMKVLIMCGIAIMVYFFIIPLVYAEDIKVIGIPIGATLSTLSVVYLIMEARSGLPVFYGKSQSSGSNANASVIMGIGIAFLSNSIEILLFNLLLGIALIYLVFVYIKKKSEV